MTDLVVPQRFDRVQHRAADIEHLDLDEGMLLCRAVPYEHEVMVEPDLWEVFTSRAFERAGNAPSRCKLWHEHGGPLIGHAREIEDRPDGVWVRAKISDTVHGQEARELARDGSLDQVSITFRPMREFMKAIRKGNAIHIRHARAALLGVALVAHGAYADQAFVANVRDATADRERERRLAGLHALSH